MDDRELQELFTDPAHQEVVELLKASRPATPPLDPHFRSYLKAKLMTEARRTLTPAAARPWYGFLLSPRTLTPAMAAVAAGFLIVLGIEVYLQRQPTQAPLTAHLVTATNVQTAEPIVIEFSGPVNKAAVEETVQIEPATAVSKQWVGDKLILVPTHPLAPNTTYTVTFKPQPSAPASSVKASARPGISPTAVAVHFSTVRAPVPPVIPPSFRSGSVSYGFDSRLADSGTVLNTTWTPTGQLLVTRPAGLPGAGANTASPSAPAGAQPASTDVWLMSTMGTPIRLVAPGGNLPAAAPAGGLFAAWHQTPAGGQANLEIRDLQGNLVSTAVTIDGSPDRPAVWLGTDRLAYVDKGVLRVVGLHAPVEAPTPKVDHGSIAASPAGDLLAVESTGGSVVLDLATGASQRLADGAGGFAWSSKGDLAFTIQRPNGTEVYLLSGGKVARIATSPAGQSWSDLNWAPDASSILLASKATGSDGAGSVLMLIDRDGGKITGFGSQREYQNPQWSPMGDLVLFTRRDEAGGRAFWTATAAPSDNDSAQKQALAEVDRFMQARIHGDATGAQAELDDAGRAAYQAGANSLLPSGGARFSRYYPVTIQLTGSNPSRFLVGVRIFLSKAGNESSFFEEQLTLLLQGQRYLIDGATASPVLPLRQGPSVVSVQVLPAPPGQQVRVRFDADLQAQSVTADTVFIRDADGKPVAAKVTFDADNHLAIVTVRLRQGNYQLVVTTGVSDINGAALPQEYVAPIVISR
jgi:hypothetical protein